MITHVSEFFTIDHIESKGLLLPKWTGKELTAETFMSEMKNFTQIVDSTRPTATVWDHSHFSFQIPEQLYGWIDNAVNIPCRKMGLTKAAFILGEDVLAQFSTMDSFNESETGYLPGYFSNAEQAIKFVTKKAPVALTQLEQQVMYQVDKDLANGTASIRLNVSLEMLPFYLKKLKEMQKSQQFFHDNYKKYLLLTRREREVLGLLIEGLSNKQIADKLYIAPYTMTTHRRNILTKLNCKNMAALTKYSVFLQL